MTTPARAHVEKPGNQNALEYLIVQLYIWRELERERKQEYGLLVRVEETGKHSQANVAI